VADAFDADDEVIVEPVVVVDIDTVAAIELVYDDLLLVPFHECYMYIICI
jgi:hypothetical protein